jgi:hypothetical protein
MITYTNKIKDFVIKYNLELFVSLQLFVCTAAFLIYPTFGCFLSVSAWLNCLTIFYLVVICNVPIFLLFTTVLLVLRLLFLTNSDFFLQVVCILIGFLLFLTLAFYTFKSTKVYNFFVTRLKNLTSLETSVSDKLQTNFPAFGALNLMVSSLFISFNFLYHLDAKTFLFYIDSYSELFTPIAFIFSVLALCLPLLRR